MSSSHNLISDFWLQNPKMLWSDWNFLPVPAMEEVHLYNTMSRLVLVLSLLLFILGFVHWWLFLILGLVLVISIWWVRCWRSRNSGDDRGQNRETPNLQHSDLEFQDVEYYSCQYRNLHHSDSEDQVLELIVSDTRVPDQSSKYCLVPRKKRK